LILYGGTKNMEQESAGKQEFFSRIELVVFASASLFFPPQIALLFFSFRVA